MIRSLLSRSRAHVISLGAALSLLAAHAWGLGLGEIKLNSALNEKLKAEIELLDASEMQPDEVRVSLASAEDFERVGVERFFFLTDLRFEVASASSTGMKVNVTSTKPITEPYLNFIVEVLWPNGRLLKEYTLLLDPPTFSSAAAPVVAPPARTASGGSGDGVTRSEPSGGTRVSLAPPSRPAPRSIGGEMMTDQSDTLWEIAKRTRPEGVSIAQDMLAIQRLNPQAFIRNNINLLKAGYTLRLPTAEEARALSQQQAIAMVAEQNSSWRAYTRGEAPAVETQVAESVPSEFQGQVDATAERAEPAAEAGSEGELRIVAGAGDSVSGTAAAETVAQLDAAREEQDRLSREVDELAYELDRERELAANQLAVKDRQLEVKDQQIAELQAQMAQVRQELNEQRQNQNQSAPATESAGEWWQSSYVLGGAAGALVLALVAGLMGGRRKRSADDEVATVARSEARTSVAAPAAKAATAVEAVAEQTRSGPSAGSASHDAAAASGDGDALAEAEIYISYGRYPRAISLLQSALEEEPERDDVRLKLLELYVESGEQDAFSAELAEFMERCHDEDMRNAARELEARATGAGTDVAEKAPAPVEAAVEEPESNVMDFDLGFDDESEPAPVADENSGESEFELELDEDDSASRGAGDQLGGDLGIDFKPGANVAEADEEESEVATIDEDEFDFDLESDGDTAETKLDLAKAYIDMGDDDGARDILKEVLEEGNSEQQAKAQTLLEQL